MDSYSKMLKSYLQLTQQVLNSLEGAQNVQGAMDCLRKRARYLHPLSVLRKRFDKKQTLQHLEMEGHLKYLDRLLSSRLQVMLARLTRDRVLCTKWKRTLERYVTSEPDSRLRIET